MLFKAHLNLMIRNAQALIALSVFICVYLWLISIFNLRDALSRLVSLIFLPSIHNRGLSGKYAQ